MIRSKDLPDRHHGTLVAGLRYAWSCEDDGSRIVGHSSCAVTNLPARAFTLPPLLRDKSCRNIAFTERFPRQTFCACSPADEYSRGRAGFPEENIVAKAKAEDAISS